MAWDALKGVAQTATFSPDSVWSGVSAQVLKPSGKEAATPTPSVDSTSTTVASAADPRTLTLASVSGVSVGAHYLVTADGWSAVCEVASIDGTTVTLTTGLPDVPAASDTFVGVDISVSITGATLDEYGANWRVRVYTAANQELVQVFHVVRHLFQPAATEADVRELVNEVWRNQELPAETYRNVAGLATEMVRQRLLSSSRYPYLQGDSDALKHAGRLATRLVLLDWGLIGPGWDASEYEDRYHGRFKEEIGNVVQSLSPYDSSDDDSFEDEPIYVQSVRLVL